MPLLICTILDSRCPARRLSSDQEDATDRRGSSNLESVEFEKTLTSQEGDDCYLERLFATKRAPSDPVCARWIKDFKQP